MASISINRAEQLKKQLDNYRPLSKSVEARIFDKFRLEWNYHSNKLEGNSLTYGETKALILFGITAQGKPLKDHFEITGHNEAIKWILDIVKEKRQMTEAFIRQLHQLLLKEPYYSKAVTKDGEPTRKKIEVGQYKSTPNHVQTSTGEVFRFAEPEETPAKMAELMKWFRHSTLDTITKAATFHYRFILIHPFDDGNGRVARILMNFILLSDDYPPAIIKATDREEYLRVLRLADAGQLTPFVDFIAENVSSSLALMVRAAQGESIEEQTDIDKEVTLLKKKYLSSERTVQRLRSPALIKDLLMNELGDFVTRFFQRLESFNDFYIHTFKNLYINNEAFIPNTEKEPINLISNFTAPIDRIVAKSTFEKFRQIADANQAFECAIIVEFKHTHLEIFTAHQKSRIIKRYHETIEIDEIDSIINYEIMAHKKFIEDNFNI
jgi:Fic family protein